MILLHPFQRRAKAAVLKAWEEHRSCLMVLPTGGGKTICFSSILSDRRESGRSLVLAHRKELIHQAVQKIQRVTGLTADMEMGAHWADTQWHAWQSPVLVSSVQTQISGRNGDGRMTRFKPDDFGTIIIDEAHRATSKSYARVLDHYRKNPNVRILGVTATPNRSDEESLGQVFETCAFDYRIEDAIGDGWLVPVKATAIHIEGLDLSQCRADKEDLNGTDLAREMERDKPLLALANAIWRESAGRKTLVFTPSVHHAERLCAIFNTDYQDGSARFIHAKTPDKDRREILNQYRAGQFQILTNCSIFLEGFDEPGIEVVVPKPTKSSPLFAQMLGRGTRTLPGVIDSRPWEDDNQQELGLEGEKECAAIRRKLIADSSKPFMTILDIYCQAGRHRLVSSIDALAGKYSDAVVDRARKIAEKAHEQDPEEALKKAAQEIQTESEARLERERVSGVRAIYSANTRDYFTLGDSGPIYRVPKWGRGEPPTPAQKGYLTKHGVDHERLSKGEASAIILKIKSGPACSKHQWSLRKAGLGEGFSQGEADKIMQVLRVNGWQWPADRPRPVPGAEECYA